MSETGPDFPAPTSAIVDSWGWTEAETAAVLADAEVRQNPKRTGLGGKTWGAVRTRIEGDPAFGALYKAAREVHLDRLEHVTEGNACDGWEEVETVYEGPISAGLVKETRVRSKWSPQLALGILAARRRAVYGKRETVEHTGLEGGGIRIILPQVARDVHPKEGEEGAT